MAIGIDGIVDGNGNGDAPPTNYEGATARHPHPIALKDPAARLFVLARLISAMEEHDGNHCEELAAAGLSPAFAERLRNLPFTDAARLVRSPHFKVGIVVDWLSGEKALERESAVRNEQALFEEFVRRGASTHLLRRLFKAQNWRVRKFAHLLEDAHRRRPGNVALPDPETREAIGRAWHDLTVTHPDLRRRYLALHERFPQVPLTAIEKVVQRFDAPTCAHPSPPRRKT
jgi:hypothetical protein